MQEIIWCFKICLKFWDVSLNDSIKQPHKEKLNISNYFNFQSTYLSFQPQNPLQQMKLQHRHGQKRRSSFLEQAPWLLHNLYILIYPQHSGRKCSQYGGHHLVHPFEGVVDFHRRCYGWHLMYYHNNQAKGKMTLISEIKAMLLVLFIMQIYLYSKVYAY